MNFDRHPNLTSANSHVLLIKREERLMKREERLMTLPNPPAVVLDTCVVSTIHNPSDPRSSYYEERIKGYRAVISFQTVEELLFGAYNAGWGERRENELRRNIAQYEVIWPNAALVDISARLRCDRRKAGRKLETADAWIAATAIMLECPLATNDEDFVGIPNLEVIIQSRDSGVQLSQPI